MRITVRVLGAAAVFAAILASGLVIVQGRSEQTQLTVLSDSDDYVYSGSVSITPEQLANIERAYREIPHQRTPFRAPSSKLATSRANFLAELFYYTDLAVVERVRRKAVLSENGRDADQTNVSEKLAYSIEKLSAPRELEPVRDLISQAINEQNLYFQEWGKSGQPRYFSSGHALVQRSHGKLLGAYHRLRAIYPQEDSHNTQAFFDHLCALDFI